ncbi:MAG: twin-arginine translocase TatA/TatE family subunit [Desulforhopalus sp.]
MFGIGLPEMILILALALIVVGPDKLPDLARSLAKGLMELKKTAEGLKESFKEEGNPLDEIRPDLEEAAKSLKQNLLDTPPYKRDKTIEATGVYPPEENAAMAYQELLKQTGSTPESDSVGAEKASDIPKDASHTSEPNPAENSTDIEPQKPQSDQ